ncbi:MspA family porin [Tsukamurella tyrosinosolvens]|uniref:MspA family porin n=1 Tax=Tsukamurella tyrosinosolvens TaxID=57704 RepID=UPI001CE172F1|nr:MspA family porin [Tsukamurella tyrosinosolvens]MCA4994219.1 MspA family porin [Tsukamurella tyrosinosolvens]
MATVTVIAFSGASVNADPAPKPANTDIVRTKTTPDGFKIIIKLLKNKLDAVPPLDSSPFSREAFLAGDNTVKIEGPAGGKLLGASFETGYQIGYPAKVGADGGATVTLTTPDLSVNGGVNGGLNASVTPSIQGQGGVSGGQPSGSVGGGVTGTLGGNVGANVGAQSKIIPSQTATFKIEHGGITEVPIAKIAMTSDFSYLSLSGVHLSASGAAGQMTVRTFTRVIMRTELGSTQHVAYGPAIRL